MNVCNSIIFYLIWTPLMVHLKIPGQLLQMALKGLCKLLCRVVHVVTRVSINVEQGWTVLMDPNLEARLATPHDSTRIHQHAN